MIKEAISLAGLGMLMLSTAYAEDSRWSYRIGATNVAFDASAKVSIDGTRVPGGSADASDNNALTFDFGYIINDNWNARLIVGIPPTTKVTGAGTLPPILLGRVQYAPTVLSATYNLPQMGLVRPYVGAGINYTRILKSKDANLTSFDADHAWAPVLHIGAEANINRDWFVSFDIRKLYLKTDASGFLGPQVATARVTLNPLLTSIAIGRRF